MLNRVIKYIKFFWKSETNWKHYKLFYTIRNKAEWHINTKSVYAFLSNILGSDMSKFISSILLAILIIHLSALPVAAEDKPVVELGEVVVTGTRNSRDVTEVPAAIGIISKEAVEESRGWNVGEVLGTLPGVQSQTKNGAYDSHIIIRGAGAKAAYGVREIMIMVDGIPITDPDSFTRLDVVDTALIERIEVLKGPSSTLYGANAAGGVINIITKDPLGYQGFNLKASHGSYNSQNYNMSYGGQLSEKFFYFLSGSRRSVDSWRVNNEFEVNQFNAKLSYLIDDTSDLNLLLSYSENKLDLPSSLTKEEFEEDMRQVSSTWQNMARNSKTKRVTLDYKKQFAGGYEFKTQLYFQDWKHYHPVPAGINDGGAKVFGTEIQFNIPHKLWGTENFLTVGLSGQRDDNNSEKYAYDDWNQTPPYTSSTDKDELMSHSQSKVNKWGVYFEESLRPIKGLIVDLGLRYDEVRFDLDNEEELDWECNYRTGRCGYVPTDEKSSAKESWERFSPKVGATYALRQGVNIYGTISTGFQTPTRGEIRTNNDLGPQKAINYEVGFKGRLQNKHSLDLAFFHTSVNEEIIKLMDNDGLTFYDNAGKTLHRGVELSGRFELLKGLYLETNYAYSDFTFESFDQMERTGRNVTTYSRDGNRIPLVPEHQYGGSISYRHTSGVSGKISFNRWEKYFVDTANSETYRGFTVVNVRLGYDWQGMSFFVRTDNIFDEKYAAEVSKSYGTTRFTPGAPRTFTAGISYKF